MREGRAEAIESPVRTVKAVDDRMVTRVGGLDEDERAYAERKTGREADCLLEEDAGLSISSITTARLVALIETKADSSWWYRHAQPLGRA